MKKLATLLAVFLIGTASVFAQWDCDVTWSYLDDDDCQPKNLPTSGTFGIRITLDIKDVANGGAQVTVPNPVNTEIISAFGTNFTEAQCQVKDYCDSNPPNQPSFTVTAYVEFVDSNTFQTFCSGLGQETNRTCNDFSNTVVVDVGFN